MELYLGLDPSGWKAKRPLLHYPVIRIEPLNYVKPPDWPEVTHLLFTSKSAVAHWEDFEGKTILAIGEATGALLKRRGLSYLLAPFATQEGMIELLKTLDLQGAYLVWPRSTKARDVLSLYLQSLNVRLQIEDLYETHYQKLEPVPSLDLVEEIIFTSPSTVEGFLQSFGSLPKDKKLTAIGPITAREIEKKMDE